VSPTEFLQAVLVQFGYTPFNMKKAELIATLNTFLIEQYASGRKVLLIVDEAQNLTPKQMKTLITRAGPGTKVVCLGNIAQIDTPYLTEGSSGLTYVVDRFKGWDHNGHITLVRGERSRLADYAAETL
jgi:predicted ribonuclease YlaK